MKKILLISFFSVLILATGCVSKKYAKRGNKYESAGMWELAAESYMRSLTAKRDNIDAIVGLKRSGQKVVDEKCMKTLKAYESDDLKETVYSYLDAVDFKSKAAALGVELSLSNLATDYFNEAKPKYVEKVYSDAQLLIESEKFQQAEALLSEIEKIEPGYGNVQDMLKISKCEPLYRQGNEFMSNGLYRKAYSNFDTIIKKYGNYKDSKDLKDESLEKALITIRVEDFKNQGVRADISRKVQGSVMASLNSLNNPFIKIVDTESTNQIIDEQKRSVELGNEIQIGKILAAKAILSGAVIEYNQSTGKLNKTEKRGYLKETTTVKNPTTGVDEKKVSYKKVLYYVYDMQNSVSISLKFQLSSTESGTVMVSDVIKSNFDDALNYAEFSGSANNLVPGYWERINKDSPKDIVSTNQSEINGLQKLLKADKTISSVDQLIDKAIADIAKKTAQKINQYNPEQ